MTSTAMNSTAESLPKTGWALRDLADAMGAQVDGLGRARGDRAGLHRHADARCRGPLRRAEWPELRRGALRDRRGRGRCRRRRRRPGSGTCSAELGGPRSGGRPHAARSGDLGRWVRELRDLEVVGITGSCGKRAPRRCCTCSCALRACASSASPASFNNDVGCRTPCWPVPRTHRSSWPSWARTVAVRSLPRGSRVRRGDRDQRGCQPPRGARGRGRGRDREGALPAALPEGGFCVLNADCPPDGVDGRDVPRARALVQHEGPDR